MNLYKLQNFIKFAQDSNNPFIRNQANMTQKELMEYGEDESEATPELKSEEHNTNLEKAKDPIDGFMDIAMKELNNPDANDTSFGKVGSAYVKDIRIDQLPKDVQEDIKRFIPDGKATIVMYGMVVDELLPKVDQKNFTSAAEHIKKEHRGEDRHALKGKFLEHSKKKFILLMNDAVIDGNHHLAKAKDLNITSSLNVLDLTPARVVEKKSMLKKLAARLK